MAPAFANCLGGEGRHRASGPARREPSEPALARREPDRVSYGSVTFVPGVRMARGGALALREYHGVDQG